MRLVTSACSAALTVFCSGVSCGGSTGVVSAWQHRSPIVQYKHIHSTTTTTTTKRWNSWTRLQPQNHHYHHHRYHRTTNIPIGAPFRLYGRQRQSRDEDNSDDERRGKSNKSIKASSSSKTKKEHLPTKDCVVCHRPFAWRKKWERCWDEVTTCSKKCNSLRRSSSSNNDTDYDDDDDKEDRYH